MDESCIYCIEGHWNYGSGEVDPSVEPILEMLRRLKQWPYVRRDCATHSELKYWINEEWCHCLEGSILYFATHGGPGRISLSHAEGVTLDSIAETDCKNCWVHFGGCSVLSVADDKVKEFMAESGATVVSGYAVSTGWTDVTYPPAVALELLLFSSAAVKKVKLHHGGSRHKVLEIAHDLKDRFPDCGFKLHTKESLGL